MPDAALGAGTYISIMSSAAPAQKVSGASTIEEFKHGESYLRIVGGKVGVLPQEAVAVSISGSTVTLRPFERLN